MPAKNGSKHATQAQLAAAKGELKAGILELDKKIDGVAAGFDKKIGGVAAALVKTQGDVRTIKEDMKGMATKADVSNILSAIDAFARKAETYDRKALSHGGILQEHENKLRDHDRRLAGLEAK